MSRTVNIPGAPVALYSLDEAKALVWIDQIIDNFETDEGEGFEFDQDWSPRDPSEASVIDQFIYQANHTEGVLSGPAGALYFNFESDDDGGYGRYLIDIEFGVGKFPETLRLATMGEEMRKMGGYGLVGRDAALELLRQAVGSANYMIERLNMLSGHRS